MCPSPFVRSREKICRSTLADLARLCTYVPGRRTWQSFGRSSSGAPRRPPWHCPAPAPRRRRLWRRTPGNSSSARRRALPVARAPTGFFFFFTPKEACRVRVGCIMYGVCGWNIGVAGDGGGPWALASAQYKRNAMQAHHRSRQHNVPHQGRIYLHNTWMCS